MEQINNIPPANWKKIRVMTADGTGRSLKVYDQKLWLPGYDDTIRQIAITGHGKIKPALVKTNEYEKFIANSGEITIADDKIEVKMKKKRDLPELLTIMKLNFIK